MSIKTIKRRSVSVALSFCVINWLLPGAGFYLAGDKKRGLLLFGAVIVCFLIGVLLGGYILPPQWVGWGHPQFNIVGILSYIVQGFFGGGWILLQIGHASTGSLSLNAMAGRSYSDLGSFYIIVAGSLNYFITVRLYDLLAGTPELSGPVIDEEGKLTSKSEGETAA